MLLVQNPFYIGEEKELICNNIIFTYNYSNELSVWVYSNGFIPYYDNELAGYFDLDGNKISCEKRFWVYDTTDNYRIFYDTLYENFYTMSYENDELFDLESTGIKYYGDSFLITSSYIFRLDKNNNMTRLSNKEHIFEGYKFINIDMDTETIRILPYEQMELIDNV